MKRSTIIFALLALLVAPTVASADDGNGYRLPGGPSLWDGWSVYETFEMGGPVKGSDSYCTGRATMGDVTLVVHSYYATDERGSQAFFEQGCANHVTNWITYAFRHGNDGRYCDGAGGRLKGVDDGNQFAQGSYYCHAFAGEPGWSGPVNVSFHRQS